MGAGGLVSVEAAQLIFPAVIERTTFSSAAGENWEVLLSG